MFLSLLKEFQTFEFALMKTFAMTLGELDYENDFILPKTEPHYPEAVNIVFVLFVLTMPIILMNMLVRHLIREPLHATDVSIVLFKMPKESG